MKILSNKYHQWLCDTIVAQVNNIEVFIVRNGALVKKNTDLANALTIQSAITAMYERSIPEIEAKNNGYKAEIKRLNKLLDAQKLVKANSKPMNDALEDWKESQIIKEGVMIDNKAQ